MRTTLTVTGATWITPVLRRIHLRAADVSSFAESIYTDRYVKLVFPKPAVDIPDYVDLRELRDLLAAEEMPDVRTYTALFPDVDAGTLSIDFVIHGTSGVAGPWAANAEIGDTLVAHGPGGGYRPDAGADWHLLVGDESALPAITAALDVMADSATVRVVLQLAEPGHEPVIVLPRDSSVLYVYRSDRDAVSLLSVLREMEWPPGRVQAFIHGEAQIVMHTLRPYLLSDRGLPREDVSISGYWREGRDEAAFRRWKSEQNEAASASTPVAG